jgi:hypothetical protein
MTDIAPPPEPMPTLDLHPAERAAADRPRWAESEPHGDLLMNANRAGGLAVAASAPVVIRLAADALHYLDPDNCAGPSWAGGEPVDAYAYCICGRPWFDESCEERDRMRDLAAALEPDGKTMGGPGVTPVVEAARPLVSAGTADYPQPESGKS